ncbi:MAG: hypothetical protein K2Y23_02990 [Cyanobacteria bacterium]|nr:hypothetical protein [Cyanobacteriota bacterium]
MRHLLIAGVIVLTSTVAAPAQTQLAPANTQPMNLHFIQDAPVGEALGVVARLAGITLEFDKTVTEEMQKAKLAREIRLNGASLEETISVLASTNGLTYTIIGPKTVRISKKD